MAIVRHFFYCLLISIKCSLLSMPPTTQVKAVSSLLFPAQPILQGSVMVAHNPTSQPQLSSSTTHHQRPDTADTSSSSPTIPLLSILNVDYVMMPLSPMEPMEFRLGIIMVTLMMSVTSAGSRRSSSRNPVSLPTRSNLRLGRSPREGGGPADFDVARCRGGSWIPAFAGMTKLAIHSAATLAASFRSASSRFSAAA